MKSILAALGAAVLGCGPALAQPSDAPMTTRRAPAAPDVTACAGAYGALAKQQVSFGVADSLMGERYSSFVRIDFEDRFAQLARKSEKGITELKTQADSEISGYYMKLVDAETEGDLDVPPVHELADLSNACDRTFGFAPSLGG